MRPSRWEGSGFSTRRFTRRSFLRDLTVLTASVASRAYAAPDAAPPFVQTVLGPVPASRLGLTLPHEHVMCDFIGAELTNQRRWEVEAVVKRMRPFLAQMKQRGMSTFVDCTPAYIGRDPRVLKRLAQETGLHIVTNTGYYGGVNDKFVPRQAYDQSIDQLADHWIREWQNGIDDTGVKPGFIKTGVDDIASDSAHLSAIDEKLVRAAARASRRTGSAVTCHTGGGSAGLVAAQVFAAEKADPGRFIVAHSDSHGLPTNRAIAEMGAWVSFDAISRKPLDLHLKLVSAMMDKYAGSLLLSHDNGWYEVGKENGGEVRDFNYISDVFLPALRKTGVNEAAIRKLTVENPARAFVIS